MTFACLHSVHARRLDADTFDNRSTLADLLRLGLEMGLLLTTPTVWISFIAGIVHTLHVDTLDGKSWQEYPQNRSVNTVSVDGLRCLRD